MKRKLFLYMILLCTCLNSCNNNDKYSAPVFKDEKSIKWEHVSEELVVMNTHKLFEYKDWLILIASKGKNKDSFYLYDKKSGDCFLSGVKSGNGPKETISGTRLVSFQKGILSYYDDQQGKRLFFSIDEYVTNGIEAIHEEEYKPSLWTVGIFDAGDKKVCLRNKGYMSKDTVSVPRIEVIDKEGVLSCYSDETIEDPTVRFWAYMQPKYTASPDGSKFAMSSTSGATIMESFSIGGGIKNIATKYFFEPRVKVNGYDVQVGEDSVLGISDMCSTDNWIIASYDGTNTWYEAYDSPNPKVPYSNIAIFDWNGNPIRLYRTNNRINQLCIEHSTGIVYAVIKENDGSYYISRAKLN